MNVPVTILTALLTLLSPVTLPAQHLPMSEGGRSRCGIEIDMGRAHLTGLCLMLMEEGVVKASMVNEFGVSYVDFTYSPTERKVRLLSVNDRLDRWYIRRALRRDLRELMENLRRGQPQYTRGSRTYRLLPEQQ